MMKKLFNLNVAIAILVFCYGITYAQQAPVYEWARGFGATSTSGASYAQATAVDGAGNIYITGPFTGTLHSFPGKDSLIAQGSYDDIFLAKYDATGNLLWAKSMGGLRQELVWAMAVDTAANVYITGYFADTVYFSSDIGVDTFISENSSQDVFLAKYDSSGNYLWAKSMGGTGQDQPTSIDVDEAGNVYIAGWFGRSATSAHFDRGGSATALLTKVAQGQYDSDMFIAKYDKEGKYIWAKNTNAGVHNIVVGDEGDVYITGSFRGTVDFNFGVGIGTLVSKPSGAEMFIAKYDSDGNYEWAQKYGGDVNTVGSSAIAALDIDLDITGNIYVTGSLIGRQDLDPGPDSAILTGSYELWMGFQPRYTSNAFLAKYDSIGNYVWAIGINGPMADIGKALVVDRVGNVFVTGEFQAKADFNTRRPGVDTLVSKCKMVSIGECRTSEVFVAKYDTDGNYIWTGGLLSTQSFGNGIAMDRSGNVYAVGAFNGTTDFDPGPGVDTIVSPQSGYSQGAYLLKLGCGDTSLFNLDVSLCGESSYTLHDSIYTNSGIYALVFTTVAGCDSTYLLNLILNQIEEPVISVEEFVLSVKGDYTTYQWLLEGKPIDGATESTYAVTENGDYQVIVTTENGCTDTSAIYPVTNWSSIAEANSKGYQIRIYPNPVEEIIHIVSPFPVAIKLSGIDGRVLLQDKNTKQLRVKHLASGTYFLNIYDQEGRPVRVEKIVKR